MAFRVNKTALIIVIILALAAIAGAIAAASWVFNKEARAKQFLEEARILADQGQDEEAVIQYRNAIKNDPDNAVAHIELAAIYVENGALNKAYKHYKTASEKDPYNVDVLSKLASFYSIAGQWEDLRKTAARIVSLAPRGTTQQQAQANT